MLYMGFAEADVTPDRPVEMVGFGRPDELSRGIMAPLLAQVTVWRENEETCCLCAIDHIGFCSENVSVLRGRLGAVLGISREKVMLCFSHTHSGPNDSANPAYFTTLCDRAEEAARKALAKMRPVAGGWQNAETDIGVNRRADSPELDARVGILRLFDAETRKPLLLLLRVTCHANVLKGDSYLLSPDFFGEARDILARRYSCPVLLTQGASGDIAPRIVQSTIPFLPDAPDERFRRSENGLRELASKLADDAAPAIEAISPEPISRLRMQSRVLELHADVPSEEQARQVANDALRFCGIDGTAWLAECARLRGLGIREQPDKIEAQSFHIGRGCLCGVPNEILCAFAVRCAETLRDAFFFFGGYTNGCTGYFPTEEEFDKGGYEVYWSMLPFFQYHGRVFPLQRDSAGALIRFIVESVENELL